MTTMQTDILLWAATQPAITGLVVFGLGVVYAFFGFRFFQFLLAVSCAMLGWLVAAVVATAAGISPTEPGIAAALVLGGASFKWQKPAAAFAAAGTWTLLTAYLAGQVGLPSTGVLVVAVLGGGLGLLFAILSFRTMVVVVTTMQGVVLMAVGWVTLASRLVPSIGGTFRCWANSQALVLPIFLAMLFATAFSYQAMHRQGDIKTGA